MSFLSCDDVFGVGESSFCADSELREEERKKKYFDPNGMFISFDVTNYEEFLFSISTSCNRKRKPIFTNFPIFFSAV